MKLSEKLQLERDYNKWLDKLNEDAPDETCLMEDSPLLVITFLEEIGALKSPFTETVENRDAEEKHNRIYLRGKVSQRTIEIDCKKTFNVGDTITFENGRSAVVTSINHYLDEGETDYIVEVKE